MPPICPIRKTNNLQPLTVRTQNYISTHTHIYSHTVFETAISKLQWRDEDGDLITIATDADLAEAINVADGKPLKLICSATGPSSTTTTTTGLPTTATSSNTATITTTTPPTFPTTTTATLPGTLPVPTPVPAYERAADDGTEWSLWLESRTSAGTANDWARLEAQLLRSPRAGSAGWVTAMRKYRHMLASPGKALDGTIPHLKEIVQTGVVPRFVEFLKLGEQPVLQFEAAWALTNIAAGDKEDTQAVVEAGAIVHFIALLESPSSDVREQAVWALGNIAGDGPELRDVLNQHGVLTALLRFLDDTSTTVATVRIATWTVSNLCRGKVPPPDFAVVSQSLPTLTRLLNHADDEVVVDACWALSYLSSGTNDKIQTVIEAGPMRRLVELLSSASAKSLTPALRTVGNIVTGTDVQTQEMLFASPDLMPSLNRLLSHTKQSIQKEACWTISNITAGTTTQIQAVMDCGNVVARMVDIVSTPDYAIKVRKEATWAIANAISGGRPDQVRQLVAAGCIPALCSILNGDDHKVVDVALGALGIILKATGATSGGDVRSYAAEMKTHLPRLTAITLNVDMKYSDAIVQKAAAITTDVGITSQIAAGTAVEFQTHDNLRAESRKGAAVNGGDDGNDASVSSGVDEKMPQHATDLFGLNEQTKFKTTSIMIAASLGHCETLAALLEAGGDAIDHSIANKDGYTALMLATENNHVEAVKLLLKSRAQQIDAEAQCHV